ncbi:MAG: RIO-like kinase [Actinobacteria bacterium 13_2_20CM_2_71_6]|nr:MAG: RIO-like kinase [Actinobacteria bacterium 13_2_20CM_2_71_6]
MRDSEYDRAGRGRRRRFDDDEPRHLKHLPKVSEPSDVDGPETGDRWSTWDLSQAGERGPQPYPDWVVTELAAVDTELGIVKTGKEADVFLVRRGVPDTDRQCLLAAKRYRSTEHRMFHRDVGYLEGRRVRESRTNRAMAKRTGFGREMIAGQWAAAEFAALYRLWEVGVQLGVRVVPYPVQILGTELLLEFLGTADGEAAPRLAQLRPDGAELTDLWHQAVEALVVLARCGLAHGDLSPYNILVDDGRLVLIDLPQVVDVVSNPHGARIVNRDVRNVATWFAARGLAGIDADELTRELLREAGIR